MKKVFNNILNFLIHFLRRLLFFTTKIIFSLVCGIIFLITYEPKKFGVVTKRKIKRIRRLTNFKLMLWKNFSWYINFIHDDYYYRELVKRFGNKVNV